MKILTLSLLTLSLVTYADASCFDAGTFASGAADYAEQGLKKSNLSTVKKFAEEAMYSVNDALKKAQRCGCPASKSVKRYARTAYDYFIEAYSSDTLTKAKMYLKGGWEAASDAVHYVPDCTK
jgi:hypothetical protein